MIYAICSMLVLTLCTSPLLAADAELVVEDAQGNEVLRLNPDDASTGPQNLPAGRYKLKVDGPGEFELLLDAQTVLEFRGGAEPPVTTQVSADDDTSILIDFDPAEMLARRRAGARVEELTRWPEQMEPRTDPPPARYLGRFHALLLGLRSRLAR